MQRVGCLLTIVFTIPIVLTFIMGIPGLIIGVLIAIVGITAFFMSDKKKPKEVTTTPKRESDDSDALFTSSKKAYSGPLTINARPPKRFTIKLVESVPVAGISHKQDALQEMIDGSGRQIGLVRQPDHPKDSSAIKVLGRWIDGGGQEHVEQLGYVPAKVSRAIADKYPDNELKGCLKVIYQPQPEQNGGIRFDIYAAP